jgi:hypothetical protein
MDYNTYMKGAAKKYNHKYFDQASGQYKQFNPIDFGGWGWKPMPQQGIVQSTGQSSQPIAPAPKPPPPRKEPVYEPAPMPLPSRSLFSEQQQTPAPPEMYEGMVTSVNPDLISSIKQSGKNINATEVPGGYLLSNGVPISYGVAEELKKLRLISIKKGRPYRPPLSIR